MEYSNKDLVKFKDMYLKTLSSSNKEFQYPVNDLSEIIISRYLEFLNKQQNLIETLTLNSFAKFNLNELYFGSQNTIYRFYPNWSTVLSGAYDGFHLYVEEKDKPPVYFCHIKTENDLINVYNLITNNHLQVKS